MRLTTSLIQILHQFTELAHSSWTYIVQLNTVNSPSFHAVGSNICIPEAGKRKELWDMFCFSKCRGWNELFWLSNAFFLGSCAEGGSTSHMGFCKLASIERPWLPGNMKEIARKRSNECSKRLTRQPWWIMRRSQLATQRISKGLPPVGVIFVELL